MKIVALRFSETFAPECGTIAAHQKVINEYGYVWYGKLGLPLSEKYVEEMRKEDDLRILLIQSSKQNRYWAKVACMQKETPPLETIPEYYRANAKDFHYWFKILSFQKAENNVQARCIVLSSNEPLSNVSRGSINPYFKIEYKE